MNGTRNPREQGAAVARCGGDRRDNPFPRASEDWHAWMEGYLWARRRAPTPTPTRSRLPAHHGHGRPAMVAWPSL